MNQLAELYLAGGCFWGMEHFLKQINGVEKTAVGYANGRTANPTYREVCDNDTGYAETVHGCVYSRFGRRYACCCFCTIYFSK